MEFIRTCAPVILCDPLKFIFVLEDSRTVFLENSGCEQLAGVLKSYSGLPVSPDNEKLKCVICGCLSNTCSEQNGTMCKMLLTVRPLAILTV